MDIKHPLFMSLLVLCCGLSALAQAEPTAAAGEGHSKVSPPVFSKASGFHDKAFTLTISHPDPDVRIYYTLDGSVPDPGNLSGSSYRYKNQYPQNPGDPVGGFLEARYQTHRYTGPLRVVDRSDEPDRLSQISTTIHAKPDYFPTLESPYWLVRQWNQVLRVVNRAIDWVNRLLPWVTERTMAHWGLIEGEPVPDTVFKGTCIRAVAVKDTRSSELVTHNFFIAPRQTFALPVVAITVPEKAFFDFDEGVLVAGRRFEAWRAENPGAPIVGGLPANWNHSGKDIHAHLQLFAPDRVLDQDIGIRPHGGNTRLWPNKSLRLYARGEYGQKTFDHAVFPDQPYERYKRLVLRNSGNDGGRTLFRDAAVQRIMQNLHFDTQAYQPAVVFLNAEYRGILNFRERYDQHYFERRYGIKEKNIDLLNNNARVKLGDAQHWQRLIELIEQQDITQAGVYAQVAQAVDIQNFIDYKIANLFVNNRDWPHNNIDYWRYRADGVREGLHPKDGRWRWLMFDTDYGLGLAGDHTVNTLAALTELSDPNRGYNAAWSVALFTALLKNTEFKHRFITRFADLLNTDFQSQRMVDIIQTMQSVIEPEMPRHIHRWGHPKSMRDWQREVDVMIDFANKRPDFQRREIIHFFGLEGDFQVEIGVSDRDHGQVRINSLNLDGQAAGLRGARYPWKGHYFKGVPIELEAIAQPGQVFSHWVGVDAKQARVTLTPSQDLKVQAVFVPAP